MDISSLKRKLKDDDRIEIVKKPKWALQNDLASWASTYKIRADSFTSLLKILREYDNTYLKSDSRSVMNTPRDTAKLIRNVYPGQYIHIGIEEGIIYTLRQNLVDLSELKFIVIDYDMDGVQMTESTDNVFWPIWCKIQVPKIGKPFLVGNYYSSLGQPNNFNCYTLDFVTEFKKLINQGLKIGYNKIIEIRAGRFLGDSPGRCDVLGLCSYFHHFTDQPLLSRLGLKHPTGYYGCGRCTAPGCYIHNRVCFTDLDAPLRTDKSFADRLQPQHHHFKSLLEELLELECISQSPADGMHLVYACAVKRLMFWYNTDTVNFKLRLSSQQLDAVNVMLNLAMLSRPREFARPVKDIRKYKKFKCTQFREFLLYLSIVVMKKVLTKFQYEHLLLFVIGIRILSDEKQFKMKNDIAKSMLYQYVDILGKNFGLFRLIYSIHNLIHLADECLTQNEPLDAFSMWEFETANARLKEFTKRQGAYLEQSYNRTMEKYRSRFDSYVQPLKFPFTKFEVDKEYDEHYNVKKTFFSRVDFEKFILNQSEGNRWFLAKSGDVGQFDKAIVIGDKIKIRCRVFKHKFNYFDNPLNSSHLKIFKCYKNDLSNFIEIDVKHVEFKMFMIPDGNSLVFVPLL